MVPLNGGNQQSTTAYNILNLSVPVFAKEYKAKWREQTVKSTNMEFRGDNSFGWSQKLASNGYGY